MSKLIKNESLFETRLKNLQSIIWKPEYKCDDYVKKHIAEVKNFFSKDEMIEILDTARQFNMPILLEEAGYGFGRIGVVIFENEKCIGVKPEALVKITEDHLDSKDCPWIKEGTMGSVHNEAWELFSSYTHSEANKKRLEYSGLPLPRDRVSYEY